MWVNNGWRVVAIGSWRLVVVGGGRLGISGWRLVVVGGGQWAAVGGWWSLGTVLKGCP